MGNRLRSIFNPTKEELQEQYDRINKLIRKSHVKYGECCRTCRHCIRVQESPYYDYSTCEFDRSLEFGFGDGSEKHWCEKYEYIKYLKVEEDDL